MPEGSPSPDGAGGSQAGIPPAWLLVVLALVALRAAATFTAPEKLWGLDTLAYRGPFWTVLLLLFAFPLLNGPTQALGRLSRRIAARQGPLLFAFIAGMGALFVLFRSRNFLLGDSQLYVHALREGVRIHPAQVREAGATYIVSALHWALRKMPLAGSETAFVAASVCAGILFVTVAFFVARLISRSAEGRALIFVSLLAGGFLQIFFGHAEYYGLVAASGILYVLASLRWLKGKGTLIWPSLALAASLAVHIMNGVLLPSFLWLLVRSARRRRYLEAAAAALLTPGVLIAFGAAIKYAPANFVAIFLQGGHMLPVGKFDPQAYAYSVFELVHLREIANELLLVAPVLPLLATAAVFTLKAPRKCGTGNQEAHPRDAEPPAGPRDELSRETGWFLFLLALTAAAFCFAANPALGMARDWDIFAFPYMLITLAVSSVLARSSLSAGRLLWLCGAAAVTGGLHLALFVDNNRTPSAYAPRFRRIAAQSELFTYIPRAELWRYLGWEAIKAKQLNQAREDLWRSIEDNPVQYKAYKMLAVLEIGKQYDLLGSARNAARRRALGLDSEKKLMAEASRRGLASYYNDYVEKAPNKTRALIGAGLAALEVAAPDTLIVDAFRRAVESAPDDPDARSLWGDILRLHGELDRAEWHYREVLKKRKWHIRARIGRACVLGARGEPDLAFILVKELLDRYPWSVEAQLFMKARNEGKLVTPKDFQNFMITE